MCYIQFFLSSEVERFSCLFEWIRFCKGATWHISCSLQVGCEQKSLISLTCDLSMIHSSSCAILQNFSLPPFPPQRQPNTSSGIVFATQACVQKEHTFCFKISFLRTRKSLLSYHKGKGKTQNLFSLLALKSQTGLSLTRNCEPQKSRMNKSRVVTCWFHTNTALLSSALLSALHW